MCPDKDLISAYFDGETDHLWSEKLGNHIDNCGACSNELQTMKNLGALMADVSVPGEEVIRERMYENLERRRTVAYSEPFWKKHFEVSFSVLAGAAAVIIVLCAALLFGLRNFGQPVQVVDEITPDTGDLRLQVISMEDASAYLLSDDSGFDVLITIPVSESLSVSGEPQLIREADYKRSQ